MMITLSKKVDEYRQTITLKATSPLSPCGFVLRMTPTTAQDAVEALGLDIERLFASYSRKWLTGEEIEDVEVILVCTNKDSTCSIEMRKLT